MGFYWLQKLFLYWNQWGMLNYFYNVDRFVYLSTNHFSRMCVLHTKLVHVYVITLGSFSPSSHFNRATAIILSTKYCFVFLSHCFKAVLWLVGVWIFLHGIILCHSITSRECLNTIRLWEPTSRFSRVSQCQCRWDSGHFTLSQWKKSQTRSPCDY